MRYSKEHKPKTRQKIIDSACRLFVSKGYAATSIDEVMHQCGLTHGGFYAYFRSKSQLYHEAISYAAARGELLEARSNGDEGETWIDAMLEECLHAGATYGATASRLAFFATDVASREAAVRAAYTNAFKFLAARILSHTAARQACTEDVELALAAMIIGAATIARTTDDAALKAKLAASCQESARILLESRQKPVFPVYFWMVAGN